MQVFPVLNSTAHSPGILSWNPLNRIGLLEWVDTQIKHFPSFYLTVVLCDSIPPNLHLITKNIDQIFFSKSRHWKQYYRSNSALSFTRAQGFIEPSGLVQHCTISLMLLPLQNPLHSACGAESAVVLHHIPPWSPPKGQGRAWLGQPCAQAVFSCWNKPMSWHKSKFHVSHCSCRSPISRGSLKVCGRQLEMLAPRTWKELGLLALCLSDISKFSREQNLLIDG